MDWYSATIQIVSLVGDSGITLIWDNIYLIQAIDREAAWTKARALGTSLEETYTNGYAETVRWAFVGVVTLDNLGNTLYDGMEVGFQPQDLAQPLPIDLATKFHPNRMQPGYAGIGKKWPNNQSSS